MTRIPARATLPLVALALAGAGIAASACGGTSSSGKTATAAAKPPAATRAAATSPTAAATTAAASPTAAATTAGSPTAASGGTVTTRSTAIGTVLADDKGFTLYTFANDQANSGKSVVNGALATAWPPLITTAATPPTVAGATGTFTIITRDDGSKQIAYKGMPLYRFANDTAPGDTSGDKLGNVWFAAVP